MLTVCSLLPCLASCVVHPAEPIAPPPVVIPQAFSQQAKVQAPDRWWTAFDAPELDSMVESALAGNLNLQAAWARLDQARAIAVQAGAARYPSLSGGATASRTRVDIPAAGPVPSSVARENVFGLSLAAGYEVDLWGRIRSQTDAAAADAAASRQDLETAAITLAAAVGDTWFAIAEQLAQRELLAEQVRVSKVFLELAQLRRGQGQGSALDVYQQRTQLAATEGQVPLIELRLGVLEHQLAVLLGRAPNSELPVPAADLPALPPMPDAGLPAELLDRRPDVRAARLRVESADLRVGVAVANLLPSLRLTAAGGYEGGQISDLFDARFWTLASDLTAPLFEGGRRRAEVDRARAALDEVVQFYGQTVLRALQEVEDALHAERHQREYVASLTEQVRLAGATLDEARMRYANGLSDYLNVLTSLAALQRLERDHLAARQQLISIRIQLYRALAGSWPEELTRTGEVPDRIDAGDET